MISFFIDMVIYIISKKKDGDWYVEFECYILQILHGLIIAQNNIGFVHNDLHTSNIMTPFTLSKDKHYCYVMDNKQYVIPTYNRCWKIIDYGYANITYEKPEDEADDNTCDDKATASDPTKFFRDINFFLENCISTMNGKYKTHNPDMLKKTRNLQTTFAYDKDRSLTDVFCTLANKYESNDDIADKCFPLKR